MSICASCGRPIGAQKPARSGCTSCAWRAAIQARTTRNEEAAAGSSGSAGAATAEAREPDDLAASHQHVPGNVPLMIATLREYAALVGEELGERELRVFVALCRGNSRPYRFELNRLVSRFVDRLEQAW
jgi:hypothetical protein